MSSDSNRAESGFTLIEALIAMALMFVAVVPLAQMFFLAATANQQAGRRTLAHLAARQKMEDLRSGGGPSLLPSPADALQTDRDGYNDVVYPGSGAGSGGAAGGGGPPLVRRWSIAPLPADPVHLLLLQVVVLGPDGRIEAQVTTLRRTGAV